MLSAKLKPRNNRVNRIRNKQHYSSASAVLKVGKLTANTLEHNVKKGAKKQFFSNNLYLFFASSASKKTKCQTIY